MHLLVRLIKAPVIREILVCHKSAGFTSTNKSLYYSSTICGYTNLFVTCIHKNLYTCELLYRYVPQGYWQVCGPGPHVGPGPQKAQRRADKREMDLNLISSEASAPLHLSAFYLLNGVQISRCLPLFLLNKFKLNKQKKLICLVYHPSCDEIRWIQHLYLYSTLYLFWSHSNQVTLK